MTALRRTASRRLAGALALVAIALSATAFAQGNSLPYRVKQDDTLDVIAAEFYGDRSQARLIIVENKLKKKIQPGQRLRIPITRDIVTAEGDTFKSLAQQYLGDERRAELLADYNERDDEDTPPLGTLISIPIQITYTAQATETLAQLAGVFWNDAKQAEVLKRHNFLDKGSIDKGESIVVTMLKVRVRKPTPLDAESKQRRENQQKATADAARALPIARTAWLGGDFETVKATLEPLATQVDYLETPQAIEVDLLLAKSYLAVDDSPHAMESFTRIRTRKPTHMLSAYYESPKVTDAWKKAGGQVAQ